MRMTASWLGHYGPAEYKVVARCSRPMASSPSDHRPDHNQRGRRARALSRRGLETTERAARAKRRPTLTGPVRVGLNKCVGRGEETGFRVEQRNWNEGAIIAPQPCIRQVRSDLTMMQSCASAAKLLGGGPILETGFKTMACFG